MAATRDSALYRSAKWGWLISQCLLLPLSVLYISRAGAAPFPAGPWQLVLVSSAVLFLVLWLIAQSLLAMYRFPLDTPSALQLVMGQPLTFGLIFLLGGLPLFAAFTTFYTTLAAISACAVGLAVAAVRRGMVGLKQAGLVLLVLLPVCYWLVWLFLPIYRAFVELPTWERLMQGVVLVANIVSTGRALWGTTIFADKDEFQAEYDEEWQHWAAPTIIGLILSAVAAAVVGGLAHR